MKKEQVRKRDGDPGGSHRLFLLLFFLSGAILLRFWPPMRDLTDGTDRFLPWVMLLPALLGGSPCGILLIPTGALLLGASAMRHLSAAERFSEAFPEIAPLFLLTPLFFLTAVCGMRMSEDCLTAFTRGGSARRRALILRQTVLWGAAFAVAAWIRLQR